MITAHDILTRLISKLDEKDLEHFNALLSKYREKMVLAGGSISNTILSIIDNKEYPINDIDIYISVTEDEKKDKNKIFPATTNMVEDDYGGCYINIWKVYRFGFLNVILCNYDPNLNGEGHRTIEQFSTDILSDFDLNCVKAAVYFTNISSEYKTQEEFDKFIKTRQIEITSPNCRTSTIFRLLKKKDDLNAYVDLDKQYKLFSLFMQRHNSKYGFADIERYQTYLKYKSIIDEYFNLEIERSFFAKDTEYNSRIYKIDYYLFSPKKFAEVELALKDHYCSNKDILNIFNQLEGFGVTETKRKERLDILNICFKNQPGYSVFKLFAGQNPNYFEKSFLPSRLEPFSNFLEEHREIVSFFASQHKALYLADQLVIFEHIRSLAKDKGDHIIPMIFTNYKYYDYLVKNDWLGLEKAIAAEIQKGDKLIGFNIPVDIENVTLLNTKNKLQAEGTRMHHCVGGYAYYLEQYRGMIFHIEAENPSTLRVQLQGNPRLNNTIKFIVGEHRAAFNRVVDNQNIEIQKQILDYLNSDEFIKKVRSYFVKDQNKELESEYAYELPF